MPDKEKPSGISTPEKPAGEKEKPRADGREREREKPRESKPVVQTKTPAEVSPPAENENERRGTGPATPPPRERRKYKVSETPPAPPPPPQLKDYEPILGRADIDELRFLARQLRGKTVKMVNSTAVGGGVAEILNLLIPQYLFYPCIDPLSEKNKDIDEAYVQKVCDDFGVDRSRPILTQISRYDRLKDPVGVIEAYKLAKKYVDCQLVLAGGGASDDPEGAVVLAEVMEAAGDDQDIIILNIPPWSALEINALQRAYTIVIQKSLREGFGLTVTEALWKGKPVIAGAVGGIPSQVIHKLTGILVHSVEGCAYQIRYL